MRVKYIKVGKYKYMLELSLLWPKDMAFYADLIEKLNASAQDNLNLLSLCSALTNNRDHSKSHLNILTNLCSDEEVIAYRQEIFSDLMASPDLVKALQDITHELESLNYLEKDVSIPDNASLFRYFARLKELNGYVSCISSIFTTLENASFQSRGLKSLHDAVKQLVNDEKFTAMSKTLEDLTLEVSEIKSINIGLNLNHDLNPVEATIISINKTAYKESSWKRKVFKDWGLSPDEGNMMSKVHQLMPDSRHPICYHLYKDIESFVRPVVRDMHVSLRAYKGFNGQFLVNLLPELLFYLDFAFLITGLIENGMPFCKPEIAKISERMCCISDAYNINLALHMINKGMDPTAEMVLNEINFDQNGRVMVLTGPNRGGKTVYTEATGLEQILFQSGVYIPGTQARISPVDCIYTHFPVDENQTVELGRLGEEAKRLNDIFSNASQYSLILLNESLSSTSFTEGLYIAQDLLKSLKLLEARALFNTHMHDLANAAETINSEVDGDSLIVSLVTELSDGERSYKIKPGAPLGKSYARDIALKYGICFEQVAPGIKQKKLHTKK